MTYPGLPMACDGARVRLFPGYAALRAGGRAGRQAGEDDADIMVFAASQGIVSADLLAGFWRHDAATMDWLADFLCDPDMDRLIVDLQVPDDEAEEEQEEIYDRRGLTTLGSDVMDPT
jgi:hypothetical protein